MRKLRENWRDVVEDITQSAKEVLGDVHVVAFGSVVEGKVTESSDVDVLIVVDSLPLDAWKRAKIKSEIEEKAGLPPIHPVQMHLITWKEARENPIYKEVLSKRSHR
jgi:hypothetical protein